jgi:uncharacterized cupredoxin-like copper-binding protein
MNTRARAIALATAVGILAAACGSDGSPQRADATKAIELQMIDIAFEPERVSVGKGEEVRFVFVNNGKVKHEAYIGTTDDQAAHETEMTKNGPSGGSHMGHGGGSGEGQKLTVEPGKRGELTHRFDVAGTYEIGCHEPGHYSAGMKVVVDVG